jgi:hypothetical protein
MGKDEIIQGLKTYNKWRRGDETIPQPNPTELGILIDQAIKELEKERWIKIKIEDFENIQLGLKNFLFQDKKGLMYVSRWFRYMDYEYYQELPEPIILNDKNKKLRYIFCSKIGYNIIHLDFSFDKLKDAKEAKKGTHFKIYDSYKNKYL